MLYLYDFVDNCMLVYRSSEFHLLYMYTVCRSPTHCCVGGNKLIQKGKLITLGKGKVQDRHFEGEWSTHTAHMWELRPSRNLLTACRF